MANNNVKFFKVDTQAKYDALLIKDPNALYWILETSRLYLAGQLFAIGEVASDSFKGLLSPEDYVELKKLIAAGPETKLTPVDGSVIIVDNKIGVGVSKTAGNLITVTSDGLFVDSKPIEDRFVAVEGEIEELKQSVVGAVRYRGAVETVADLPKDANVGDLYEVREDNSEWCWNGEKWCEYGNSKLFVPVPGAAININGSEIGVKLSPVENNVLVIAEDGGLYVADNGFTNEDKAKFDAIEETYASKIEMEEAIAKAIEEATPVWSEIIDDFVEFDGSTIDYTQNTAFQRAIKDLPDGSTVMLKNGNFRVAFLDEYSVPKNLTVVGGTGAVVTSFSLETNIDGLTLRNLNFAEGAYIYGIANHAYAVKNLTVDGCTFEKGFIYLGLADGSSLENIVITNCEVYGAVENFNGVTLYNVHNATIKGNTISNSDDIGIALLGTVSGIIDIEGNIVAGTGDRALRVNNVKDNAVVTYKNNIISDCAVASVVDEGVFKVTSTGVGAFIIFNGNTYNGTDWSPNNIGENSSAVVYVVA